MLRFEFGATTFIECQKRRQHSFEHAFTFKLMPWLGHLVYAERVGELGSPEAAWTKSSRRSASGSIDLNAFGITLHAGRGAEMNVDGAYEALQVLLAEAEPRLSEIETEQDSRLQLINRMLTEILGWNFADIKTEPASDKGYTDYLLAVGGTPSLVIEAKRVGKLLVNTASKKPAVYTVKGPSLKAAADGLTQAAGYCLDHGVDYAVLTTGEVWIAFIAFPGGGRSYRDGKAIVFPSFEAIVEDFPRFFDMFSKEGIHQNLHKIHLTKAAGLTPTNFEPLVATNLMSDLKPLPKSQIAQDLDPVFKGFFSKMSGQDDRAMLLECFVETRESRHADAALQKLIGNVSDHVAVLSTDTGEQLADQIETIVTTGLGENILIVGHKGAGKSTFIERFFDSVLDDSIRQRCVIINIDLLDATGDISVISNWLTAKLKTALMDSLFEGGIASFDELQGLYFKEYKQWSDGQYAHLYASNKIEFKIKFGDMLNEKMEQEPFAFVQRLLADIVRNRHLLPCIIFDNTDHYKEDFQEAVFQWSQALRREVHFSLVVLPITDRTIWRLSKSGPFQTYESKTFYLPVPSTKEILTKRIGYLRDKADDSSSKTYFLGKGIKLSLENISAFASALEEVFISEDFVSRRIGWLCNHDVRRSLRLSQDVMTSPFLSIDDLIGAYLKRGQSRHNITVSYRKFMQALVLRAYNQFQQTENAFVLNVFETSPDFPSTPLLRSSILKLLIDKAGEEGGDAGYVAVDQLHLYFEAMGISRESVSVALTALLDYRLIEPYDASNDEFGPQQRVGITHSGRMHQEMVQEDPIYISQMAFATSVRSMALVERLRAIKTGKMHTDEWAEVRRAFVLYCLSEDRVFVRMPQDRIYDGQRELRSILFGKWVGKVSARSPEPADDLPVSRAETGPDRSHVQSVVKWFDPIKGFGFLDTGSSQDIFLHARTLKKAGMETLNQGDRVVVDVGNSGDGRLQAIQVHSIEPHIPEEVDEINLQPAVVKFFNEKKGFGFLTVPGFDEDVYISAQVLNQSNIEALAEGESVAAIIGDYVPGRGWAAQRVTRQSGQ